MLTTEALISEIQEDDNAGAMSGGMGGGMGTVGSFSLRGICVSFKGRLEGEQRW